MFYKDVFSNDSKLSAAIYMKQFGNGQVNRKRFYVI